MLINYYQIDVKLQLTHSHLVCLSHILPIDTHIQRPSRLGQKGLVLLSNEGEALVICTIEL